ncbi:MAG: cytochrome P460, partial [Terracidiphilus sp.]
MKRKFIAATLVLLASLTVAVLLSMCVTAQESQDRFTLTAPDGVAFSEFKGYETWQDVAASATGTSVKAILGNSVMIDAYRAGIPGNGKPFPEGSK